MLNTRYSIGDKIYASCFTDYAFGVEVEVLAISGIELAKEYEDILRKLFNSDNAQQSYTDLRENTVYFYICRVIRDTVNHSEGSKIVLSDSLIKEKESYYIEEKFNLGLSVGFNSQTSSYRYKHELITDIRNFLESRGVQCEVKEEITQEDQMQVELNELRSLINSLKGLRGTERVVDKLLSLADKVDKVEKRL